MCNHTMHVCFLRCCQLYHNLLNGLGLKKRWCMLYVFSFFLSKFTEIEWNAKTVYYSCRRRGERPFSWNNCYDLQRKTFLHQLLYTSESDKFSVWRQERHCGCNKNGWWRKVCIHFIKKCLFFSVHCQKFYFFVFYFYFFVF